MSTLNTFPYDTPSEDNLYRVRVNKPTNSVEVTCVGMDCIDSPLHNGYYCAEDVPKWMSHRLAVLACLPYGGVQTWLTGVGKRIDVDTYWVYAPE